MSTNGLFIDSCETRSKTAVLINVRDPVTLFDFVQKNPDAVARVLDSIVDQRQLSQQHAKAILALNTSADIGEYMDAWFDSRFD